MKSVYVETTIVSYLAAFPNRDLIKTARQQITWEWWEHRRHDFGLYISELVLDEAAAGDADAARRRISFLDGLVILETTKEVMELAQRLIQEGPLPQKAINDAYHLSFTAVNGIDFLLTWNCSHLANAELIEPITNTIESSGYGAPTICTPDELMEHSDV